MSDVRRLGRIVALVVAASLPAALPAGGSAADAPFGTPRAVATYGEGIAFSVPFRAPAGLRALELRLEFPGALGPSIVGIDPATVEDGVARHLLATTGDAHLVPNTPVRATWAARVAGSDDPLLSEPVETRYADTSRTWRTLRGEVVRVHWHVGDDAFGRRALAIAEASIAEIAATLGVEEREPIDFFIHGDEAAFRTALGPGTRENVGGQAHASIRTLFALIGPGAIDDPWVGIVIPHELVHLVLDTAVRNPYRYLPRWVNEGIAVYLTEGYGPGDRRDVEVAIDDGTLLPLTALTGGFPTVPSRTSLAYAISVSAIDHLVRSEGRDALTRLVEAYAGGVTDDEAFRAATGRDLATFEASWRAALGATAPVRRGPLPAPAGPVPPGWDARVPGASLPTASAPPAASTAPTPGPDAEHEEDRAIATEPLLLVLGVLAVAVAGGMAIGSRLARRERAP